jgi:hypothetical protein
MGKLPSSRGPARFKERELCRALRAARHAGGVERVEIAADGTINVILAKDGEATQADADDDNPWDSVNAKDPKRPA